MGYGSANKAKGIALAFKKSFSDLQKECLAFYFCNDDTLLEVLEAECPEGYRENTPQEDWDKETGLSITRSRHNMASNEDQHASYIVTELVHLHDIYST